MSKRTVRISLRFSCFSVLTRVERIFMLIMRPTRKRTSSQAMMTMPQVSLKMFQYEPESYYLKEYSSLTTK